MNLDENLPLIVIEVVMVFGGALAFGWWQLSDIRRERRRREDAERMEAERQEAELEEAQFNAAPSLQRGVEREHLAPAPLHRADPHQSNAQSIR